MHIGHQRRTKSTMDRLEFYKEIYYKEIDRRFQLNESVGKPVTIATGVAALTFYLFNEITKEHQLTSTSYLLLILIGIGFSLFCVSVVFMALSVNNFSSGYKYPEIANVDEIRKHEKTLNDYDKKTDSKDSFKEWLISEYIRCANVGIIYNDKRADYLHRSKTFIILALTAIIITLLIYAIAKLS